MTRTPLLAAAAVAGAGLLLGLGVAGWTAASTLRAPAPEPASAGRRLDVRYEVRREPAYSPPPATEAGRLDVLNPQSPTVIADDVLSARAGQALRDLQAEEAARNAAALAAIRAQDARIDRETAAALRALDPPAATGGEGTASDGRSAAG